QAGPAARAAAAAPLSEPSLPAHSGPSVLIAARRPASSRPTAVCSMPTPKSNPSRTKNPVHKMVMTMNQNGTSLIARPLVLDGGHGHVRVGAAGRRGRQSPAGGPQHQDQADGAEGPGEQDEDNQADGDPGGADRRRDPRLGKQDGLHDPRQPAAF